MNERVKITKRKSNKATRDEYASRINAAWQKSVESILEVGRLLLEAKGELSHGQFGSLFTDRVAGSVITGPVPFSSRTAQKLMLIARHPVLANPTHVSHLPPSYGTLHLLATIPDADLEEAIREGWVHPDMTRAQVSSLPSCRLSKVWYAMDLLMSVANQIPPKELVWRLPELPQSFMSSYTIAFMEHRQYFRGLSAYFADMAEEQFKLDLERGVAIPGQLPAEQREAWLKEREEVDAKARATWEEMRGWYSEAKEDA